MLYCESGGKILASVLALFSSRAYCLFAIHSFPQKEKIKMAKKLFTLLFLAVLALPLSTGVFAQESMKMAKEVEVGRNCRQDESG